MINIPSFGVEYVSSILSYNAEDGQFTWLETRGTVRAGRLAGTLGGSGYMQIGIDNRRYKSHHLAWLMHHGYWPTKDIDHENGDTTDNRIKNLRECSKAQNKANSRKYKNNKSGQKGVFQRGKKWSVSIQCQGKRKKLGSFDTVGEATAVYLAAANKLFGQFARPA